MELHLYPTTLSRDRAIRETTRAHGLLFDHRHFTYAEFIERLYRSEKLPGRLIEIPAQTVFVRHSLTAILREAPSPGLVAEYRGVIDELKGAGLGGRGCGVCHRSAGPRGFPSYPPGHYSRFLRPYATTKAILPEAGLVDQGDRDLAVIFRLRQHLTAGTRPALLHGVRRIVVHDLYHLSLMHYA